MRPGTPEGRLRRFCILRARSHGQDVDWVRLRAQELFRIPPTEGFCLSALSKPQLIQLADHIVTLTGGTPGAHRRGSGQRAGGRWQQDKTGVVVRIATQPQRDLVESLGREVFGSVEVGSPFAAFLAGLCRKSEIRTLTRDQAGKAIEALTSMRARGWKPRAEPNLEIRNSKFEITEEPA